MNSFIFDKIFTSSLPRDPIDTNAPRQVEQSCWSFVEPEKFDNPSIISFSEEMLQELFMSKNSSLASSIALGKIDDINPHPIPFAMCYGGHQFGSWAGQLGDGRAINIAEGEGRSQRWALQLKGSGPTPYSRTADGYAVLRSSIREFLCSEAMHHLGIPTTRAFSLALTGKQVLRDVLYNGNPKYEQGAMVCRVAENFIRFGNFEIFASRGDDKTLRKIVDHTINTFFPDLGKPSKTTYELFFHEVAKRTMQMILHWQRVGFVHGVMNTDNMSIMGLTIDYGPYGWIEPFDKQWTPNTTDAGRNRYRFGAQPQIALWNLVQLANALYPLIEDTTQLEKTLSSVSSLFNKQYKEMMLNKIGIFYSYTADENDKTNEIIFDLEALLEESQTDMTRFFRLLSAIDSHTSDDQFIQIITENSYITPPSSLLGQWKAWKEKYQLFLSKETLSQDEKREKMNAINPKYVLRNYMAHMAIEKAEIRDYSVLEELQILLKNPYKEQVKYEKWFAMRPKWAMEKVGCSQLSCSS